MSIQDQYTDTIRHTQESWAAMAQALTDNVSKTFGFPGVDANASIDHVFDFWAKALDMQRDVAKQLVSVGISAGEKVRAQAESVQHAGHDQA